MAAVNAVHKLCPVCMSGALIMAVHACTYICATDINECSTNNGGCSQKCNNTLGSNVCACNSGYYLAADNRTCNGEYFRYVSMYIITIAFRHE